MQPRGTQLRCLWSRTISCLPCSPTFSILCRGLHFLHQHWTKNPNLHIAVQCWLALQQARHLAFISEFTINIRHIEGHATHVADALSHNVHAFQQSIIDLKALDVAQSSDQELRELCTFTTSFCLQQISLPKSDHSLFCDICHGWTRPLVTSAMHQDFSNNLHSLPHPTVKASHRLIVERYAWLNVKCDSQLTVIANSPRFNFKWGRP